MAFTGEIFVMTYEGRISIKTQTTNVPVFSINIELTVSSIGTSET